MITFDPRFGPIIARQSGAQFNPGDAVVCRLNDRTQELVGGNIYQNYTGASIVTHSAVWRPMGITREFLYAIFAYPFIQLKCERLIGPVPSDNAHAVEVNLKLGFVHVATIPKMFKNGVDCIVMSMERDECRFIRDKEFVHGRQVRSTPSAGLFQACGGL